METVQPSEAAGQIEKNSSRPKWGRIVIWVVVLALLVIVGFTLLRNQRGQVQIGQAVPDFTLTTFSGEKVALQDLKGKVVVINFWASWCLPCEQEAADLEQAWRDYQPGGEVVFLGVNWSDTDKKALAYLERFGITYKNGPDLGTRISQAFRITGVPETYIVDQNGNLVDFKKGPFLSLADIKGRIEPLLAADKGSG